MVLVELAMWWLFAMCFSVIELYWYALRIDEL